MGKNEEFISARDVADRLGVTPETIRTWCRRSMIPHHRIGATIRFCRADIDAWLKSTRRGACESQ